MRIIPIHKIKINELIGILKAGGLVIAPSDTVYALLVDAKNENAVKKLIQFKNRPAGKPISIFVSDFSMMRKYIKLSSKQESLLKELLPGPFTVVLSSKHKTTKLLESEKGTLGVRIPLYQLINQLIHNFGKPITATSANLSGRSPYYDVNVLLRELPQSKKNLVDLVVDAGKLPRNKPSTVIDLTESTIKTLRRGDLVQGSGSSFISESEDQTKKIGQYLLKKNTKDISRRPLAFIIQGDLGVGKTVLVKGIAETMGIRNIVSPTFVVYYEYDIKKSKINPSAGGQKSKLIHVDLYNIQEPNEFKYLGIEKYLRKRNILCIEWGEKTGEIIDMLKSKGRIVYIEMEYVSEKEREIISKSDK